jgi:hypothetical protein
MGPHGILIFYSTLKCVIPSLNGHYFIYIHDKNKYTNFKITMFLKQEAFINFNCVHYGDFKVCILVFVVNIDEIMSI